MTANHWGAGVATVKDGRLVNVGPHPEDPDPSRINENIASSLNGEARVRRPAIRQSWLEHGATANAGERGKDPFVEVSWDRALDLVAGELKRVIADHGNDSIFAGSYGWSSAGRFHHAQSQLKRFLNSFGGFVRTEGNYSYNAALQLMPYILQNYRLMVQNATRWPVIADNSDLVVMFGGVPLRSTQVSDGGLGFHKVPNDIERCVNAGVSFVNLSPLRSDAGDQLKADWVPVKPGTDTAIMMGLAHTLLTEELHDQVFLDRYTVGFDQVRSYLMGEQDGVAKDADWAAALSDMPANNIRSLARKMADGRTMITTTAGIQRADFGEQPLWMTVTLAAMLGQIGLPGGGFGIGYGVNGSFGSTGRPYRSGTMPQHFNPVENFVPVAMFADAMLNPGQPYDYSGRNMVFPQTRMVWWAGGNPFHHCQDLNRLRKAFQQPDTIIVNEINWTSTARHADIVLPVAAPEERADFAAGKWDNALIPMPRLAQPAHEAREEYDIYCALEERMTNEKPFSLGRTSDEWLESLWQETRETARAYGDDLPTWPEFLDGDIIRLEDPEPRRSLLSEYRNDPNENRLKTPSGKIELYSDVIASFDYDDCPGQAVWMPPRAHTNGQLDAYPLHMISGQPETRLHSQMDNGSFSKSRKIQDREPVLINSEDAALRGINDGDVVELFNGYGRCLAGAIVTDDIRPGVIFLWTGAWYDPDFDAPQDRDRHGNPNVLTHDLKTSRLSQGPASHSAFVDVRPFEDPVPEITVHRQPAFATENE
ncbi:MAG: molybdopterin-dependent oxidoreductase [Boseongicola sp.]|nr:MAG: molybdopterin-dependent oxidoreductase [Boseongicola sp.]